MDNSKVSTRLEALQAIADMYAEMDNLAQAFLSDEDVRQALGASSVYEFFNETNWAIETIEDYIEKTS